MYYIGLDVSQKHTALCIVDERGQIMHEGKSLSKPACIYDWLNKRVEVLYAKVALEAGSLSNWLYMGLKEYGLDIICLESFSTYKFLSIHRNKTDKNDAKGIAQLLHLGGENFLKTVSVRSKNSREIRALLAARDHLVNQRLKLENHISGVLKSFGFLVKRGGGSQYAFYRKVKEALLLAKKQHVDLEIAITSSLELYVDTFKSVELLAAQLHKHAHDIDIVQKFMEIPGVGPIAALSFYTAIENPERFKKSSDVAAYLGLTPSQFQSGETNYHVGISKKGDAYTRRALVQSATVFLFNTKHWCGLKFWGVKLAKRVGHQKARVAVARKLAMVMHKMWITNTRFCPAALTSTEVLLLKRAA